MPKFSCPVCGASSFKSAESCQRHVEGCLGESGQRHSASVTDETVQCTYGCGAWVPLAELNDHEIAHQRAQAGATSDAEVAVLANATAAAAAEAAEAADAAAAAAAQAQLWEDDQGLDGGHPAAPKSAEALARELQEQQDFELLRQKYGFTPQKRPGQCWHCGEAGHWSNACPKKHARPLHDSEPRILVNQQQPELQYHHATSPGQQQQQQQSSTSAPSSSPSLYHVSPDNPDVVQLLKPCLVQHSAKAPTYCALLSGPVHHLCSSRQDQGWGCGWRNIQMQVSHLLARRFKEQLPHSSSQHPNTEQQQPASNPYLHADQRHVPSQHPSTSQQPNPGQQQASSTRVRIQAPCLFGSIPILPDIGSLQAWLEAAWSEGFDTAGAESLGGKIQGDHKWIGTTEACALLRHQGVRAEIIDFMDSTPSAAALPDGRTVHAGVACDLCGACPITGVRHRSLSRKDYDLCSRCAACPAGKAAEPFEVLGTGPWASGPQAPQWDQPDQPQTSSSSQPRINPPAQEPSLQQQQPMNESGSSSSSSSGSGSESCPFHLPLIEWVWNYFSGAHSPTRHMHHQVANDVNTSSREHGPHGSGLVHTPLARLGGGTPPPPVLQTGLPPLYFQHDGHSRTIIGIERTRKPPAQQLQQPPHHQQQAARKRTAPEPPSLDGNKGSGMGMEGSMSSLILRGGPATFDASRYTYTLLVLDPGIPTDSIVSSLRSGSGWQRFIRRGLHTLRHSQYQLLVCVLEEAGQQHPTGLAKQIRAFEVVHS